MLKTPKTNIHHGVLFATILAGVDVDFLCKEVGITKEFLLHREGTMNTEQIIKFWNLTNQHLACSRPGLFLASNFKLEVAGDLGVLINQSETVLEVLKVIVAFRNLVTEMISFKIEMVDDFVKFSLIPHNLWETIDLESSISATEYAIANLFHLINCVVNAKVMPVEICLKKSQKSKAEDYNDYFKTNVRFGSEYYIMYHEKDALRPVAVRNKNLYAYYLELLSRANDEETDHNSLAHTIKQQIYYSYWPYLPSAEEMANTMLVSYKSLQRRLKSENTSYRELVNQIKREYAYNMLNSKKFSITEVSEILGYADINSFSRAYKLMYGYEPSSVK